MSAFPLRVVTAGETSDNGGGGGGGSGGSCCCPGVGCCFCQQIRQVFSDASFFISFFCILHFAFVI